jgi:transposase
MEGGQRRSFTDDYKRQAVDLVASSGRSIGSVAKELGLRDSVLRRWVELRGAGREPTAEARRPTTQAPLPSADHAAEIARLQRENERLISLPSAQPCRVRYAGRAACSGSLRWA